MRRTRSEMRRYISTRLSGSRFGEKNDIRRAEADRKQQPAEHAPDVHAALAVVRAEHVGVAARVVELLRRRLHEHVVVRQLAEIDCGCATLRSTVDCSGRSLMNSTGSPSGVTSFTGPSVSP